MSKMIVREEDISNFVASQAIAGEAPLVGVYAGINPMTASKLPALAAITAPITTSGIASLWCIFCANDKRIVIAVMSRTSAEIVTIVTAMRADIREVKVNNKWLSHYFSITNVNGEILNFNISKFGVLGQPTHKARTAQLLNCLEQMNSEPPSIPTDQANL